MESFADPLITEFGQSNARRGIRRALFLDRDGVIVKGKRYLRSPEQLELMPGAARTLRGLEGDFRLVVVTNQSAVARGLLSEGELLRIHRRLVGMLESNGCHLDAVYYCPHHPQLGSLPYRKTCTCRKPSSGLIFAAAEHFGLDLSSSVMIGDSPSDILCGKGAGARTIFFKHRWWQRRPIGADSQVKKWLNVPEAVQSLFPYPFHCPE